ncbi:MAG: 50S ribosomal protein L35 [Chloroflexi bacterium]|nr:50S ribosomal protein L35 [Chloroflexota bacterium]
MPKIKTHKGAEARFHLTGSGKLMRTKGGKSHLRVRKPKRVKRLYDETIPVSPRDVKRIKRLLPYGAK